MAVWCCLASQKSWGYHCQPLSWDFNVGCILPAGAGEWKARWFTTAAIVQMFLPSGANKHICSLSKWIVLPKVLELKAHIHLLLWVHAIWCLWILLIAFGIQWIVYCVLRFYFFFQNWSTGCCKPNCGVFASPTRRVHIFMHTLQCTSMYVCVHRLIVHVQLHRLTYIQEVRIWPGLKYSKEKAQ